LIPDLSVLWVVFFVLVLSLVLDRLLFRPLTRVMQERAMAVKSARELAEASSSRAQAATAEFESQTAAARNEVYRAMDEKRRVALDRRTALLAETRRDAEASIAAATARVRAQADEARRTIDRDADSLASAVVERVLGRQAS
jgi:F-type H+-transporting ATPase subunit b